jgi:phosphate transport system ATP-binding protein
MPDTAPSEETAPVLEVRNLSVRAGQRVILRDANLRVAPRKVCGLIGPSGAGKSTLLKCLNRMIELSAELTVTGEVLFHGRSILSSGESADDLRARIGILFQQPVVFPKSIYQNVIFGIRHLGVAPRREWPQIAERALGEAALWDEVKDRLNEPAIKLSVGQQQRLCLARTLASQPEVILMDEPTSALDPRATQAIEELIVRLKARHSIVLVTHNVGQARRVADRVACLCLVEGGGTIVEENDCASLLDRPQSPAAIEYLRASS